MVFGPFLVTCNLWYLLLWAPFGGHQPVSVFPLMMLFDYCVKRTVACLVLKDLRGVSVLSCGLQCMCVCVWWVSLVPCRYPVSHQSLICWLYFPGSCWEVCCVKLVRLKVLSPIFPLILHCLFHPPGGWGGRNSHSQFSGVFCMYFETCKRCINTYVGGLHLGKWILHHF